MDMVKNLLTAQNFSMPAGYVTEEGISYLVRVGDKPVTLEELTALPLMDLHMDGVPTITLGDVADVFFTDNSAEIYTNVNGSPGCMLSIQKQTGYSTGAVSDLLLKRFSELMEADGNLAVITLMDQGVYRSGNGFYRKQYFAGRPAGSGDPADIPERSAADYGGGFFHPRQSGDCHRVYVFQRSDIKYYFSVRPGAGYRYAGGQFHRGNRKYLSNAERG